MSKKFKALKKPPKEGQIVYFLTTRSTSGYLSREWEGVRVEKHWLAIHRIYPTEKDVKRALEFLKAFIKSHKEQLKYITSEPVPETEVWYGADMDGLEFDSRCIDFDSNDEDHQWLLVNGFLYNTPKDLREAADIITKALAKEQKRSKYKFLTKAPERGTKVYYSYFGCESGVIWTKYDPEIPWHARYLKLGLFFSKEKHALRAGMKMLNQINPTIPKLLKPIEQWALLTKEGDHE